MERFVNCFYFDIFFKEEEEKDISGDCLIWLEIRDQEMGISKMTLDKWCPDTVKKKWHVFLGISHLHSLMWERTCMRSRDDVKPQCHWVRQSIEDSAEAKCPPLSSLLLSKSQTNTSKALLFESLTKVSLGDSDLFPCFFMLYLEIIAYPTGMRQK